MTPSSPSFFSTVPAILSSFVWYARIRRRRARCLRRSGDFTQASQTHRWARLRQNDDVHILRCKQRCGGRFMTGFARAIVASFASASAIGGLAALSVAPLPAAAQGPTSGLAAHRAVYDLKLAQSPSSSTTSARGRLLYDFSGSACAGYGLTFRQVSEMD